MFESGSPDTASAQSEPTTTVSVVAMHVPSGPTQAQINGLNNQCSTIIKRGWLDICRALLTRTDGVPSLNLDQGQRSWQEEIVMAGLTITVQSVAGETATINHLTKENCDKIWKTIVQTLSRLWKKIKHQASAGLQKLYGLLPPLNTPAKNIVIFWKCQVRTLLTGNKFLKEPGDKNSYLFYLSIFTSLVTKQFKKGLELWRWFPLMERSEDLDTVYALCATAISQTLKDYWDGRYND